MIVDCWAILVAMEVSAAAAHVATTVGVVEEGELKPSRSRPPDVQLRLTLYLDIFGEEENGREAPTRAADVQGGDWYAKRPGPHRFGGCCRVGSLHMNPPRPSRIVDDQNWRPSWVAAELEVMAGSHAADNKALRQSGGSWRGVSRSGTWRPFPATTQIRNSVVVVYLRSCFGLLG